MSHLHRSTHVQECVDRRLHAVSAAELAKTVPHLIFAGAVCSRQRSLVDEVGAQTSICQQRLSLSFRGGNAAPDTVCRTSIRATGTPSVAAPCIRLLFGVTCGSCIHASAPSVHMKMHCSKYRSPPEFACTTICALSCILQIYSFQQCYIAVNTVRSCTVRQMSLSSSVTPVPECVSSI